MKKLIKPYLKQITDEATRLEVNLLEAFKHAGCSRATYYRAIKGEYDLRLSTAEKISEAIYDLS